MENTTEKLCREWRLRWGNMAPGGQKLRQEDRGYVRRTEDTRGGQYDRRTENRREG
jgi:hypothetical protein